VTRRRLLMALAAVAATCTGVLAWLARRVLGGREQPQASETASLEPEPGAAVLFPPETLATLLVIADVIVPRSGSSPAASEIDLVPRLERLILRSPSAAKSYRKSWPILAQNIQEKVPVVEGQLDPAELARLLEVYHGRFRRTRRGGKLGNAFEQLRRDVLRVYYASPAGQAFAGYPGPHHGPLPRPEQRT